MQKSNIIDVCKTAANLKNIRQNNNLTQQELSDILKGVPVYLINNIENGEFIPTLEYIYDFCQYFSVSIDEVIVSLL